MNCLVPRPAQIQDLFWKEYEKSPEDATAYYYKLSQDSDYIRRYRIARDRKYRGNRVRHLDITINLSKPEKDPKAIAAAGAAKTLPIRNASCAWRMKIMFITMNTVCLFNGFNTSR